SASRAPSRATCARTLGTAPTTSRSRARACATCSRESLTRSPCRCAWSRSRLPRCPKGRAPTAPTRDAPRGMTSRGRGPSSDSSPRPSRTRSRRRSRGTGSPAHRTRVTPTGSRSSPLPPDVDRLSRRLRRQAAWCAELGSPLYASLLESAADDLETGGPVMDVLSGFEEEVGAAALALRLMGAVHRLVLEDVLPELAERYPSTGGDGDAGAAW